MSRHHLDKFLGLLKASPGGAVFKPWWQIDAENDVSRNCPGIRRKQLTFYFYERLARARLAIIGEALGYRGGHFTGIPMTSERMLLGKQNVVAALSERRNLSGRIEDGDLRPPLHILSAIKPTRTSRPAVCTDGFSE